MRYKENFSRDWGFYLKNRKKFTFSGSAPPSATYDKNGADAKLAFHRYDSQGKLVPTKHPRLLQSVIQCKRSVNFHIKMWAEGYDDFGEGILFYLALFDSPPDWVEQALRGAVFRVYYAKKAARPSIAPPNSTIAFRV